MQKLSPFLQYVYAFAHFNFGETRAYKETERILYLYILPPSVPRLAVNKETLKPLVAAGLAACSYGYVSADPAPLTYEEHCALFHTTVFQETFLKFLEHPAPLSDIYVANEEIILVRLELYRALLTPSPRAWDFWRRHLGFCDSYNDHRFKLFDDLLCKTLWSLEQLPSHLPDELNVMLLRARLRHFHDQPVPIDTLLANLPSFDFFASKYYGTFYGRQAAVLLGCAGLLSLKPILPPNNTSFNDDTIEALQKVCCSSQCKAALAKMMQEIIRPDKYALRRNSFNDSIVQWLCLLTLPHLNQYPFLPKAPLERSFGNHLAFLHPETRSLYMALAKAVDGNFEADKVTYAVPALDGRGIFQAELLAALYTLHDNDRPAQCTDTLAQQLVQYAVAIAGRGYRLPALVILTALQRYLPEEEKCPGRQLLLELQHSCAFSSKVAPGFFKSNDDLIIEHFEKIFPTVTANAKESANASAKTPDCRIVWVIGLSKLFYGQDVPEWLAQFHYASAIEPFYQTRKKNGDWSVLKEIRASFLNDKKLSEEDKQGLAMRESYPMLLQYLVGKETLFRSDTRYHSHYLLPPRLEELTPLKLTTARPKLELTNKTDGSLHLKAHFPVDLRGSYNDLSSCALQLVRKTDGNAPWELIEVTQAYRRLAKLFEQYGKIVTKGYHVITIPASCKERFMEFIAPMAAHFILIGNAIADTSSSLEHRDAKTTLVLAIREVADEDGRHYDLKARFRIWESPELNAPVHGGDDSLLLESPEGTFAVDRNRPEEKRLWQALLDGCPSLADASDTRGHWYFDDLEPLLKLLEELPAMETPPILDWQNLPPISCRPAVCSFHGSSGLNWFDIGADVPVDESHVLSLAQLLALLPSGSQPGSYINVGDRHYLSLTSKLRKTLAALRVGTAVKDDIRLGNAALPALLANLPDDDRASLLPGELNKQLKKLRQAMDAEPELPKGLQCTLREYQVDGFVWLSRLATAGIGACLADDMGVGKTLQLLTLMLSRAPEGPSIVFAPASVCRNWCIEAARFTPGLHLTLLAETDREQAVKLAGPYDVLVVSYGLLPTCAELLKRRQWNCLILDEAQAIKNMNAQRSHLAKELPAAVRIASTGTPVENNLLEFWNIFDFLNPGLLGSHSGFIDRWMENGKVRPALRQLSSPLLLRRMKADVLSELPPKTEVNLEVELSPDERVLYEKLRQEALADVGKSPEGLKGGNAALKILAHLTKLRRFCCHPSLTLKELSTKALPGIGSKLSQLMDIAQELRSAGHPALIFSQYVDMLALVKEAFDTAGFSYCYLDGATPSRARQKEVDRFQHGDVDFFLISLKAGGTGLNLTAANYVVILDPWWNPAVENQAADRTYRIGQRNPVTVYRLVTKATIEERVLELQAIKRDIATQLLDDQASTRLSPDLLMQLLRENS